MLDIIKRRVRDRRIETEPLAILRQQGCTRAPMADSRCDLCGDCVKACPASAITIEDDWIIDTGRCLFCGDCVPACPKASISLSAELPAVSQRSSLVLRRNSTLPELKIQLRDEVRQVLGRSLAIREVDAGSCNGCEVEVNSLSNPIYDLERFGIKIVASPRHADMLLVTGPVTRNMLPALLKTYQATPEPRLVAAMGTCAISGGPFGGTYAAGSGVAEVLPVDIFIPGCPPHPRTVVLALLEALGRLQVT
ncbi:MAG TPA: NADH-quinone oxidoreductase subunit NuoB [Methanomassiliicoccales archaeon]|nr:NADH-quinone oxidoreductase subunit NuoB [Methanomassiliicoccales archaeon]